MPIEDATCRGCGALPELVRGSWEPHPPGAPCHEVLDQDDVNAAREAAFDLDTAAERGVTTCQDGLHIFPNGGGKCHCGQDFLRIAPTPLNLSPPWYLEP